MSESSRITSIHAISEDIDGYFTDEDMIRGTLSGGEFRERVITFEREDLFPD